MCCNAVFQFKVSITVLVCDLTNENEFAFLYIKSLNAPGTDSMNQILEFQSNYIETYTFKYFKGIPT